MLSEGVIGDKLLLAIDAFQKCCGTAVRWGHGDFKSQNDETEASTGHRSYYIQGNFFFGNDEFQTSMPGSSGSSAEE